jgi:diaminohydroxyphosphoribosylaminopyrimidine deaminase/5-amino-6-(5-phosphoribosylamino)uracil reductase
LTALGVELLEIPADASGRVELQRLMEELGRRDIAALLVEGGATTHGSFVDQELLDEAVFFIAPMLIGGPGPSAVAGRGIADLELAPRLRFENLARHGHDLEIHAVRPEDEDVHGSD